MDKDLAKQLLNANPKLSETSIKRVEGIVSRMEKLGLPRQQYNLRSRFANGLGQQDIRQLNKSLSGE